MVELTKELKDLMISIKDSLSSGSSSLESTEKKLGILKLMRNLDSFISDNSQWLINSTINSLKISFDELLLEEQQEDKALGPYFENFEIFSKKVQKNLDLQVASAKEVFEEFLKHDKQEQISFLKNPDNQNLMEFFIPFLDELADHQEVLLIVLKEVYNNDIEYREPFLSVLRKNFYMQGIAAQKSNDPMIIFEILSLQNEELERRIMLRVKHKNLPLPAPGLFEYWGFLSKESRLQLIQDELKSMDQFIPIARGLALQAREESTALWSEIIKLPLFPEIEAFLKDDTALYESCLEKWPNLFLRVQ